MQIIFSCCNLWNLGKRDFLSRFEAQTPAVTSPKGNPCLAIRKQEETGASSCVMIQTNSTSIVIQGGRRVPPCHAHNATRLLMVATHFPVELRTISRVVGRWRDSITEGDHASETEAKCPLVSIHPNVVPAKWVTPWWNAQTMGQRHQN